MWHSLTQVSEKPVFWQLGLFSDVDERIGLCPLIEVHLIYTANVSRRGSPSRDKCHLEFIGVALGASPEKANKRNRMTLAICQTRSHWSRQSEAKCASGATKEAPSSGELPCRWASLHRDIHFVSSAGISNWRSIALAMAV
jgi:hypothetical protein